MTRVLLVYRDAALGARLAAACRAGDRVVHLVSSGEQAIDHFIQHPFELVVIDYHLQGRDGAATAEAIRSMPGGAGASILLTASGVDGQHAEAIHQLGSMVGAVRAMVGTPEPPELSALVQEILAGQAPFVPPTESTSLLVSSTAPCPSEPSAPTSGMVGSFRRVTFARVLARMADDKANGRLSCRHPRDARRTVDGSEPYKELYFQRGMPVFARSNFADERLGAVLVEARMLGPTTLSEARAWAERHGRSEASALISLGAIEAEELHEGRTEQLTRQVLELFLWRDGSFRFEPDVPSPRPGPRPPLLVLDILRRGLSIGSGPMESMQSLGARFDEYPLPRGSLLAQLCELDVGDPMRRLAERIDGQRTLRELVAETLDPGPLGPALFALDLLHGFRWSAAPIPRGTRSVPPPPPPRDDLDHRLSQRLSAERHYRRAQHAAARGRFDTAVEALLRAVELCPSDGLYVAELAWAEHRAAPDHAVQLERSLAMSEQACVDSPHLARVHLLRGHLLERARRLDEARSAFDLALQLAPQDEDIRRAASGGS